MTTKTLALLCAVLLSLGQAFSQSDKALLRDLAQENKQAVEALALYPQGTRLAILEAAKYPEVLINMQSIREKTSAAFRTLIEDFPRSTQEVFFDLARYPGLIAELHANQHDRTALRRSLERMPESKRSEALDVVERHMPTLVKIQELNQTARAAFDRLTAKYPAPAQQAFNTLLGLPEVLDILNEDLRFTVLVGDVYKSDPAWVIQKVDSLSLAVARAHADELQEWQKTVEEDPQLREELQNASGEYASTYGYTDELYDVVPDDLYAEDNATPEVVYVERYNYYNYPYWFGYPWWAPQPCWRPYPYWWYWGFYPYGPTVVIVHLPSYHFMHWYFYHPHHHHVYNHLSTHFVRHYYGHRNSGTTISMGVSEWRDRNRTIISDDFLRDKDRLPARLREYADFEQERDKFNTKNPTRTLTKAAFLEKNARQYPQLSRSKTEAQTEIQREKLETERRRSDWAPDKVEPAPQGRQPRTEQPRPAEQPRIKQPDKNQPPDQPAPRPERPAKQPAKVPDIDKARDYHRDKWQDPRKTPAPKTEPAKVPQPKTRAPKPATKPIKTQKVKPQKAPDTSKRKGGG